MPARIRTSFTTTAINFDGTGLTPLTDGDGNHIVTFSTDRAVLRRHVLARRLAPVSELRRTRDGSLVAHARDAATSAQLRKAGWKRAGSRSPRRGATARPTSGASSIRPTNFDPAKKYPVIENIYAGPHGSFVPKSFAAFNQMQAHAELGFIVVQIDGMGT